jgi:hypothetical protein
MLRKLREKLTYANVVSTIAVLAALGGGSAYAASLITTSDIADNAVISRKIKNHTVKPADLAAAAKFRRVGTAGNPAFGDGGDGGCVWSNAPAAGLTGGGFNPAAFYKDPYGRVHLTGVVQSADGLGGDMSCGTNDEDAFVFRLPPGYRPPNLLDFSVAAAGGQATILLIVGKKDLADGPTTLPAGTVLASSPAATTLLGLDGVSFRAAG